MKLRTELFRRAGMMLGGVAVAAALGAAAAAVVYVNVERLDIVDRKRAVAKTVTTVDRGTPLNVLATEGKWYKVEVGGQEGYVFANAVANQPGGAKNKGVSLSAVNGASVPELATAAAARGVRPGAQQYASAKGLSTSGLLEAQRRREAISASEFDRFLQQGGLAGARAKIDRTDDQTDVFAADAR